MPRSLTSAGRCATLLYAPLSLKEKTYSGGSCKRLCSSALRFAVKVVIAAGLRPAAKCYAEANKQSAA